MPFQLFDMCEQGELRRVSVMAPIRRGLVLLLLFGSGLAGHDIATASAQAKRMALIIGNGAYDYTSALPNAKSDAKAIAAAFEEIGFAVQLIQDLAYREMRESIRVFGRDVQGAEMATVYFAGHGIEVNGENWLLPISAELRHERDLEYETVSLTSILSAVQGATKLRLVILDACRNNPLSDRMPTSGGRTRAVTRGLGRIEPSGDVLVAYSARHGTVAEDGPAGGMSPFAAGLMKHVATPGLDIRILMGRIRDHVIKATEGRQEPFTYGSVGGEAVALVNPLKMIRPGGGVTDASQDLNRDELAWLRATASNRLEEYRAYLNQYPQGQFKSDASAKIQRLNELRDRWLVLQTSRDRIDVEVFVIEVAGTEFSEPAKQRLLDLYANEERAWNFAVAEKLWKTYSAFLTEWPRGRHSENARERLRELAEIKDAWAKLASSDDEQALDAFARKHGWSEFGAAAATRLIALRREKVAPQNDGIRALSAEVLQQTIDGKALTLSMSGAVITFDTSGQPPYRPRLGKDFFRRQLKQTLSGEGSFKADALIDGRRQVIEGLGAIVKSKVDGVGSVFLLQMYGNEQSPVDVDRKDRKYASLQIIQDYFGLICIMTTWESILSSTDPEKVVERCKVHH
jgi:Caspase domain